jgi:hypothetical protein
MAVSAPGVTIVHVPNRQLIVALGAGAAAEFVHGPARTVLVSVHVVVLTFWAYEEAVSGVSWFRRLLGAGVMIAIEVVLVLALVG